LDKINGSLVLNGRLVELRRDFGRLQSPKNRGLLVINPIPRPLLPQAQ